MSLLPITKHNESEIKSHLNDYETMAAFQEAIHICITTFQAEQQHAPTVLNLGIQNGLIAQFCLEAGASHVTLLELNEQAIAEATLYLSKQITADKYSFIQKSSLQLPKSVQYDILIMDTLGSSLNSKGMAGYSWDLCRRNIIRKFGTKAQRYVIPSEGTMSVRAYHAPAISVERDHFLTQMRPSNDNIFPTTTPTTTTPTTTTTLDSEQQKKVKWIHTSQLSHFVMNDANCNPVSERVDVLHEFYDEPEQSPINWPSHIQLQFLPTAKRFLGEYGENMNECILLLEWSVCLSKTHQIQHKLLKANSDPKEQRARMLSWGYEFSYMSALNLILNTSRYYDVAPLNFSLSYKPNGGMAFVLVSTVPEDAEEKTYTVQKLMDFAEHTFAKLTHVV